MLERFAEQSDVVTTALCFLGKNELCLSSEDLLLIKKAISVLEYFDEATKELSAEKFTSISKVLPIIRGLQDSLQSIDDDMNVQAVGTFSLCQELRK